MGRHCFAKPVSGADNTYTFICAYIGARSPRFDVIGTCRCRVQSESLKATVVSAGPVGTRLVLSAIREVGSTVTLVLELKSEVRGEKFPQIVTGRAGIYPKAPGLITVRCFLSNRRT